MKGSDGTTVARAPATPAPSRCPSTSGTTVVCTFTNLPLNPAIELDKTGSAINDLDGNGPDDGDTITYSFKVTNTGNIPLSTIAVTDTKVGTVTCPQTALAVGASMSCTPKTYPITQAEVAAGKVDNTASVTGKGSNGVTVTDDDSVSTRSRRTRGSRSTRPRARSPTSTATVPTPATRSPTRSRSPTPATCR